MVAKLEVNSKESAKCFGINLGTRIKKDKVFVPLGPHDSQNRETQSCFCTRLLIMQKKTGGFVTGNEVQRELSTRFYTDHASVSPPKNGERVLYTQPLVQLSAIFLCASLASYNLSILAFQPSFRQ